MPDYLDGNIIFVWGGWINANIYRYNISSDTIEVYDTIDSYNHKTYSQNSFFINESLFFLDIESNLVIYNITTQSYAILQSLHSVLYDDSCMAPHPWPNMSNIIYFVQGEAGGGFYQLDIINALKTDNYTLTDLSTPSPIGRHNPDCIAVVTPFDDDYGTPYFYQMGDSAVWRRANLNDLASGWISTPSNLANWQCFGYGGDSNYFYHNDYHFNLVQFRELLYVIGSQDATQIAVIDVENNQGNCSSVRYTGANETTMKMAV